MRMISANGVAHHVREEGDAAGRPIVFANSLGTDLRLWDSILPLLPAGMRVIRFDMRGHGLSDVPAGPYQMGDLVADTEALLDALDVRGALFVGLSIGGMIGMGLAARRPDVVAALVLSNTAAAMGTADMWQARITAVENNGLESISDSVMQRWFSPAFLRTPELAAWRNMMVRTAPEGYAGCCAAIAHADMTSQVASLAQPVMGIAGEMDGASPPDLVENTVRRARNARFATIPAVGHLPHVEAPQAYAHLITDFIKETAHV
ncbi:3-oxoadipate enol-lactonase 2 [Shimia sp. SK013]|uniref:3-oxoadipate enol-lactonase n=1 Tax=Shimia sp. SK013 TaxID=1389006 RepID=UPI0006B3FE1E|nr:3-oxoadipate enol-lactonase [Shimia sp. SK013]KPA20741.1 3-oxoadipate enol-lactonase 2 [Shimia sp. SK013]